MKFLFFNRPHPELEVLRPRLYRIAYAWCRDAALADDLTQDALTKALTHASQLREERALLGWMIAILHHCWLDHLRRDRDFEDIDDWSEITDTGSDTPEDACGRGQVVDCVRAAVTRLPLGQRQVLTLVDLGECSYAEVAQILEIPVGTVMSRLARARVTLKDHLSGSLQSPVAPALRRVK